MCAVDDTKFSSQSLDRRSFNDTYGMYEHIGYETDGYSVKAKISPLVAQKITVSGDNTFVACAPIGTAQATAGWQVKKINVTGGDTVITWADGDANFDNIATDLTALTYS